MRVVPASRYRSDAWAKDESGGRPGTVIKVQKNELGGGVSCIVRWDRADGRPWGKDPDRNLAMLYCGIYHCGARGHFQLAVDPKPTVSDVAVTNKPKKSAPQEHGVQTVEETFWGVDKQVAALQEIANISKKRRALEQDLAALRKSTNEQLDLITEMCDNNLHEAETIVDIGSAQISDEDIDPKKADAKKKKAESEEDKNNKDIQEQKAIELEINRLWAAVENAQTAYKKKLQADEMARKTMDHLQEILLPSFFIYCAAETTEMARKLHKFATSGSTDRDGRSLTADQKGAGLFDRRQYSTMSWASPVKYFIPDVQKDPSKQQDSLEKIQSDCLHIATQLQQMKFRPESPLHAGQQTGNVHEQGQSYKPMSRPEFFESFLDGKKAEELISQLDEISKAPESYHVKKDLESMVKSMRDLLPVFAKLSSWEATSSDPKSHTDEGRKERKLLRDSLNLEMMRICAKNKAGDEKKKEQKKEDPKAGKSKADAKKDGKTKSKEKPVDQFCQTDQRRGPEYDIEDNLGGALLGQEVEEELLRARETLEAMLLRKKELDISVLEEARRKKMVSYDTKEMQTEPAVFLGSHIRQKVSDFLGIDIKDAAEYGRMKEQTYYGGRVALSDPEPLPPLGNDFELDVIGARSALAAAQKLYRLVDIFRIKEDLEALEEGEDTLFESEKSQRSKVADLRMRLRRMEKYLHRLEDRGLRRAKGLMDISRVHMLGSVRGEYLGDSGGAHDAAGMARRAYEQFMQSSQMRVDEERAQEKLDAEQQQAHARALAGRLLVEAESLLGSAAKTLEEQRPLDALVLIKSAECKFKRAAIDDAL